MGEDRIREPLRYGGWVTFERRTAAVIFPDLPGFRPRARYGAGFDASIREQLARHLSELVADGRSLPAPRATLERDGRPVRWYGVPRPD